MIEMQTIAALENLELKASNTADISCCEDEKYIYCVDQEQVLINILKKSFWNFYFEAKWTSSVIFILIIKFWKFSCKYPES